MSRSEDAHVALSEPTSDIVSLKPQPRPTPVACERCHRFKERCSFGREQGACLKCSALGEQCHPRMRKRMGRRPVARKLPFGNTSVINFESGGPTSLAHAILRDQNACSDAKSIDRPRLLCWRLRNSDWRLLDSNAPVYPDGTDCAGPLYRQPNFSSPRPPLWSSRQISHLLNTEEGFFEVHGVFMLSRSFVGDFQSTVRRLFARAPQILADAYSVALNMMSCRHMTSPGIAMHDLMIGGRCIQKIMDESLHITDPEDAAVVLLLGLAMLVYDIPITSSTTHVITRGVLLKVQKWYPYLVERPYLDTVTLVPILMDTIDCLIRRELPVVQLPVPDRCIVDRMMGVCSSLLPLLYELCERSFQVKASELTKRSSPREVDETDPYSDIERRICDWTPELPSDFFTAYSKFETHFMLAQARSYRLAALLVIHRLRFPLGIEDRVAHCHAETILKDVSIIRNWPRDAATGIGLDFPLLIATLELPGPGSEIYKDFEPLRFRRQHSKQILDFVESVTVARKNGYNGLWFDLVRGQLHGVNLT